MTDVTERETLPVSTTVPSQAVGERVDAKPFHFDAYRDTITYLYARDGLALTLKETMQVMEKRYNFFATRKRPANNETVGQKVREMVQLCWEIKVIPEGSPGSNDPMNEWFGLVTLACRLLEYGRVRQGFRVVDRCFDRLAAVVLRDFHPAAWVYGYVAGFLLGFQSPDLGRSYARYAQRLLAVSEHPRPGGTDGFCPVTPTFESKRGGEGGGGLSEVSLLCGRQLCEFHMAEMGRRRTGAPGECEIVLTDGIQYYGDVRDIQLSIGMLQKNIMWTSRKKHVVPEGALGREIRDRDGRAWVCVRGGRYDEAWSLLDDGLAPADLARAYVESPDDVISYYDTRALLARSDERRSPAQVVEAGRALVGMLKAQYGLADYRTIDAQADLEACLRKRGCDDLADEVRRDINVALDAVERMDATDASSSPRPA
ncbi:hypothetical protein PG985_011285 [Apiospora marii]|uniref:uncharacterized protein n=1 Tax=Apiospora marii TaxID=335849 RepID=UPI00313004C5